MRTVVAKYFSFNFFSSSCRSVLDQESCTDQFQHLCFLGQRQGLERYLINKILYLLKVPGEPICSQPRVHLY